MLYLAQKYYPNQYFSNDPKIFGLICQWILFGKTTIDPNLALARYYLKFLSPDKVNQEEVEKLHTLGNGALEILDNHLFDNEFLAGSYTIADMSCYPYVMLSHEGGFDISKFSNVEKWCERVSNQSGFIFFDV